MAKYSQNEIFDLLNEEFDELSQNMHAYLNMLEGKKNNTVMQIHTFASSVLFIFFMHRGKQRRKKDT